MRAEYAAFKTHLEGHTILSGKVSSALRRKNTEPVRDNYLILYPSVPSGLWDTRFTVRPSPNADRQFTFDVRTVATSPEGALLLADAALTRMVGHEFSVAGRKCGPVALVERVEEGGVEYDKSADLYFIDFSLRFWSRRG